MTEDAVTIMARLLQQLPEAELAVIHVWRPTPPLEPQPLDQFKTQAVWVALQREHKAVLQALTTAWGEPSFNGTWETAGFPTWASLGMELTYWQRGGAIAYVTCDRPEADIELSLVLGVRANLDDSTAADWFDRDYW